MFKKLCFSILFLLASTLYCVDYRPDVRESTFENENRFFFSAGTQHEDGDFFISLIPGLDYSYQMIDIGVTAPVRFLLTDGERRAVIFAERDWNEGRDYLKFLDHFTIGKRNENLFLNIGILENHFVGNGTIVSGYGNNILFDEVKRSVEGHAFSEYGEVEIVVDDLYNPLLMGSRLTAKPFSFIANESYLNNLTIGGSFYFNREINYITDRNKTINQEVRLNEKSENLYIYGVDLEFKLLSTTWYHMTPYVDYNRIHESGQGLHAGIKNRIMIPEFDLTIEARGEYRIYNEDYIPSPIGAAYDAMKGEILHFIRDASSGGTLHGIRIESVIDYDGTASIGASYSGDEIKKDDEKGRMHRFSMLGYLNLSDTVSAKGEWFHYFGDKAASFPDHIFDMSLQYELTDYLSVSGSFNTRLKKRSILNENEDERFKTVHDYTGLFSVIHRF